MAETKKETVHDPAPDADVGSRDVTIVCGLLQRDCVVLVSDRRVVYGSGAVYDHHRKLFGSGACGVGFAGSTDVAEACVGQVPLPRSADWPSVARFVGDLRAVFFDLVAEDERAQRGFDGLVAGSGPDGSVHLWSLRSDAATPQPCTIGLACVGVAGPFALAIGGQLHRPDLGADAVLGLGTFLVEAASRCYAGVGGGIDWLAFGAGADRLGDSQTGSRWRVESTARLGPLFARWPG